MPAISIVVPVYGAERYLPACLDSLKGQQFRDFEVLCVIDGSSDGSAAIARRYAAVDPRFRVFEKDNGGASSARNFGIERATGDVIMFLDADDELIAQACGRVNEAMGSTGADVLRFGAYADSPRESPGWYQQVLSPADASYGGFAPEMLVSGTFSPFIWHLAIRRDFLERENLRFDESLALGEDAAFAMAAFARMGRYEVVHDKLYRYRAGSHGSAMDVHSEASRKLSAHLALVEVVLSDWRDLGLLERYSHDLFRWATGYLLLDAGRLAPPEKALHLDKVDSLLASYFGEPGFEPMQVEVACICRGEGKFYVKCHVNGALPIDNLICEARAGGAPVPAQAFPYARREDEGGSDWVLVLPLLDVPSIQVALTPDGRLYEQVVETFSYRKVKWLSRLNYRVQPRQCEDIRDYENSFTSVAYRVEMLERFEDGDDAVWRFVVKWAGDAGAAPQVRVKDGAGQPLSASLFFFEFQQADAVGGVEEHALFQSARLSGACESFVVEACPPEGGRGLMAGFAAVSPDIARRMRERTRDAMLSAGDDDGRYRQWFDEHRSKRGDELRQREVARQMPVTFDVVVLPGCDGLARLSDTVGSVVAQSYARWTLHIPGAGEPAMGDGARDGRITFLPESCRTAKGLRDRLQADYAVFVACGDMLEPNALFEYAREAGGENAGPHALEVMYCDEDVVGDGGEYGAPQFKSRFNWDLHYCANWVGNMLAISRALVALLDEDLPLASPAWRYDCTLRALDAEARFHYVPEMLYHARSNAAPGDLVPEMKRSLGRHLHRRGLAARVEDGPLPGTMRIRYSLPEPHPLVSIIIPSKDHIDVLDACVRSIVRKSTYDAYEILVVENNSTEPETFDYYDEVQREFPAVRVLTWPAEFNYSKIVNFGASHAKGDYLLFLNNDTEVIAGDFLQEMIGCLQREEVGVVGGKLLFRDGLVQHSGMGVAVWNAVVHTNQNRALEDAGYQGRAVLSGNYSSVTGACQMVRAGVFRQVGGYDERFAVGFNDVDFCLRVQKAGYLVVFTPYALLHHYEFTSRGREVANHAKMLRWKGEQALLMREWPDIFVDGDPYTSPNLVRDNTYYRL